MARKEQIIPWRHEANCTVCRHPHRAEIERLFAEFRPQAAIAKEYNLGSRQVVARHARAKGLFEKRVSNVRTILHALIEKGMDTAKISVPPAAIVSACSILAKLDDEGRSIERFENMNRTADFLEDPRWTVGEMRSYAETGALPSWSDEENAQHGRVNGGPPKLLKSFEGE